MNMTENYFDDNWHIFGINLEISLLLERKEYHELCAQKWNGKITTIMSSENVPELSTLYSQNKKPYKFSGLRAVMH